jgi:hypothetical protein
MGHRRGLPPPERGRVGRGSRATNSEQVDAPLTPTLPSPFQGEGNLPPCNAEVRFSRAETITESG